MPTIRHATLADTQRIAEIHVAGWQTAYRGVIPDPVIDAMETEKLRPQWDQRVRDNLGDLLLAISNDQITGFCHLIPSRDTDAGDAFEISAIYIDPLSWRQGCGRALCEAALSTAKQHGAPEVTLWVFTDNSPGRRFYEAFGFICDGATKTEERLGFILEGVRYRIEVLKTA